MVILLTIFLYNAESCEPNTGIFYLFVYSLADDENYREGQVTFPGANLRKSWENPLVGRREWTPSSGGYADRAELRGATRSQSSDSVMLLPPCRRSD